MTQDEIAILAGVITSASRVSWQAAEIQVTAERLQSRLRQRPGDASTEDLAATVDLVRRLAILIQTHSSTVTAAQGIAPDRRRDRLREWLRKRVLLGR